MSEKLTQALRQMPQQEILALATSLFAIGRAQAAAGKRLTPREQEILDGAAKILPNVSTRKPS